MLGALYAVEWVEMEAPHRFCCRKETIKQGKRRLFGIFCELSDVISPLMMTTNGFTCLIKRLLTGPPNCMKDFQSQRCNKNRLAL